VIPRKFVERLVSLLPLLLLPLIIAPALTVGFLLMRPHVYRSWSALWVSDSSLGQIALGGNNELLSPAQRQSQVLTELLATQQFTEEVGIEAGILEKREPTASLTALEQEQRLEAIEKIREQISVDGNAGNLIRIAVEGKSPEEAQKLNAALTSKYVARLSSESERINRIAVDYYTEQLKVVEREYVTRQTALANYVAQNPAAAQPASIDAQYDALALAVKNQAERVDEVHTALENAQLQAINAAQRQSTVVQVADEPALPRKATGPGLQALIGYGLAASAFGALISLAYLYVTYRSDHTIRSAEDLAGAGVRLIGYFPEIQPRKHQPWYLKLAGRRNFARRVAVHTAMAFDSHRGSA
jgi:hypothetical protein